MVYNVFFYTYQKPLTSLNFVSVSKSCICCFLTDNVKFFNHQRLLYMVFLTRESKGKTVLLQTWSASEGSRKLRSTDFMTTAQDGGKVAKLTHRPPLPQEIHLVLISVRG